MGKVLCFIYDDMTDFEVTLACHFLNTKIVSIAYDKKVIRSFSGLKYYPDATVKEALQYTDVEGIIIPGGFNDEQTEDLTKLISSIHNKGKLVAAICAGTQYLARAGILDHKKYTTTLSLEVLKEFFPKTKEDPFPRQNFIDKNVVVDGNVITAIGNAFVDFAVEIADFLGEFENEKEKIDCSKHYKALD